MLVLTRRIGEMLMVGDDVNITILGVKGNQVRLGINAPEDIKVYREEVYQRIQQERLRDNLNNEIYIEEEVLLRLEEQFKKGVENETSH